MYIIIYIHSKKKHVKLEICASRLLTGCLYNM